MRKTLKYWLALRDISTSEIIPFRKNYKAGDVFRSIIEHGPSFMEITPSLAKELRRIQTTLRRIEREQNKWYSKDLDYRNSQQWRYSRKLDGLAIEERNAKRKYAELIFNATGKEVTITSTPLYGLDQIRQRTYGKGMGV